MKLIYVNLNFKIIIISFGQPIWCITQWINKCLSNLRRRHNHFNRVIGRKELVLNGLQT